MEQKIRIISAAPAEVEEQVNQLLDGYAPIMWNIQPGPNGALVTCVLVSERELRKAQLMAAAGIPGGMPRV
jgi:hypothetical protein